MEALFKLMSRQHGVATCAQARCLGISRRVELRRLEDGTLWSPFPGVLAAGGAPVTFEGRAMAAAWSPGVIALSHGSAATLHELDGFAGVDARASSTPIDVIGRRGALLHHTLRATPHYTRGALDDHVTTVGPIPVLTVPATLALLAPAVGIGPTARALDSALHMGVTSQELRTVARAWRQRGRSGPSALLMLLDGRGDQRLDLTHLLASRTPSSPSRRA